MSDPYTPWQSQPSYPDANSSLEDLARQRMGGNIRQRQGGLPSFFQRLMEMLGRNQAQQRLEQRPIENQSPFNY